MPSDHNTIIQTDLFSFSSLRLIVTIPFVHLSDLSVNMAKVEPRQGFNVAKVYVFEVYVFVKGC